MSPRYPSPRSPAEQSDTLQCYGCGNAYAYLGTDPHPGWCPACDGRGVSPAGELTREGDIGPVADGPGDSTHRVDAVDATGRTFSYWVSALDDRRAQLVRVGVADLLVTPADDAWPADLGDLTPSWLRDAVDSAGLALIAPTTVLE